MSTAICGTDAQSIHECRRAVSARMDAMNAPVWLLFDLVSPASEVLDHTLHATIGSDVVGRSENGVALI